MPLPLADFDLHRLAVYCAVVEHRSFSRAAEELFLSQPAVSAHVRALEQAFRARLLDRSHHEVVPTEAGQAVYSLAREVLARTRVTVDLVSELHAGVAGQLCVAATTSLGNYVLPNVLARFRVDHPGAHLRMRVGTRARVVDEVISGDAEFGYAEAGDLPRGIVGEPMHAEDLVFFAAPGHRLARLGSVGPRDLQQEELVTGISGTSYYAEVVSRALEQVGLAPGRRELEMGAPEATKRFVASSNAIALLPRPSVAREVARGELAELAVDLPRLRVSYQLIYRPRLARSPLGCDFLEFLRQWAAEYETASLAPPVGQPV